MFTIGQQKNHHFSGTIAIDKPQTEVWRLLTDVTQWKDWDTELKTSSLVGEFALGATGELVPMKGPKLTFVISEFIPEQSYTVKTKMPVGHLMMKRTLANRNQLTYFTDDIWFTGALKRVFGLMLGSGFKAVLPEVMENFKRLAEQHKQPKPTL
ncbi:MAG: SRPBCC family protein [Bacteroidota bacterium]